MLHVTVPMLVLNNWVSASQGLDIVRVGGESWGSERKEPFQKTQGWDLSYLSQVRQSYYKNASLWSVTKYIPSLSKTG